MARLFPDTCALVKIYRVESNSLQVRACFAPSDAICIARATLLEFPSAFYGMARQQLITIPEASAYIQAFRADLPQYVILPTDTEVYDEATRLLDLYAVVRNLRPMDAIQLGTALVEHRRNPLDAFVTTDKVLITVTQAEGLTVKP